MKAINFTLVHHCLIFLFIFTYLPLPFRIYYLPYQIPTIIWREFQVVYNVWDMFFPSQTHIEFMFGAIPWLLKRIIVNYFIQSRQQHRNNFEGASVRNQKKSIFWQISARRRNFTYDSIWIPATLLIRSLFGNVKVVSPIRYSLVTVSEMYQLAKQSRW
jgi:hypothetical protein